MTNIEFPDLLPSQAGNSGKFLTSDGTDSSWAYASILAQSSFSSASGALGTAPTFYAATVGSSYSKALSASAGVADGTIVSIRVVSLAGTSLLTITPDGSDVIRHCGANLTSIVLARLGAELTLRKRGSGWDVIYVSGRQVQSVVIYTGNGFGSTNTKIRRWSSITTLGTAVAHTDSATLGGSISFTEWGTYEISYTDISYSGAYSAGISKNTTQPTTAIYNITSADRLGWTAGNAGVGPASVTVSDFCVPGDIIRAHGDGSGHVSSAYASFRVIKTSD